MSGFTNAILRGIALLWTLLITALIGNVIAERHSSDRSKQSINFTIFVAVWSWIVSIYGLVASFVPSLARAIIMLPLDILATIFTFVSAIVLAARLGGANCGRIPTSNYSDSWIGFGSSNDEKRCREIQASTAFMWFLWVCFCGCLFLTFKDFRGGGFGIGGRSARPNMSQTAA